MAKMIWRSEDDLLNERKEMKKEELSHACQEDILSGFTLEVDEKEYHFSYDREAQVNLQERWQLFQNNMIDSLNITAHLNGEHVRIEVDKEKFQKIFMESVLAKENKIKKLREDLLPMVEEAINEDDLNKIQWDMEIDEESPESIKLRDDSTLDEEIERVESDSAVANTEILNLIALTNMMGGMGS